MPRQLYDLLLHQFTKHTNLQVPCSNYVRGAKFPDQISELLNTTVTLRYRDYYLDNNLFRGYPAVVKNMYGVEMNSRPSDDKALPEYQPGPDDYEVKYIQTGEFTVVRADAMEPYRLIAISKDYRRILINSTKKKEDGTYEFESIISEYPLQINTFIGLEVYDQYVAEVDEIRACTLRVDASEPCYSVILEFLGSTGMIRFILGDEAFSKLYDYYDGEGLRDYDNRRPKEDENPVDVDGTYPIFGDENDYKDINGGVPDNWAMMFSREATLTDSEVYELREKIIEGKIIYGTRQS